MFSLEWFRIGRAARETPPRGRARHGRRVAVAVLAGVTLLQAGCQSGPLGDCKLFSPCGFFGRTTGKIFNRSSGGCSSCGSSGVVSDAPIEYGAPSGVIMPGSAPMYGPPGTTPSSVPESPISDLEPLGPSSAPKARTGPAGTNGALNTAPSRSSYSVTRRPSGTVVSQKADAMSRTVDSSPQPAPGSAQAAGINSASSDWDDRDPLDHLPPLDLPGEVTRSAATPPSPPVAGRQIGKGDRARDASTPRRDSNALETSLETERRSNDPPEPAPAASVGPGISRFLSVDLKLSGGSVPSSDGLAWLAQKGYRTVLDLREPSEVSPRFIAEVTKRGLRYITLPTGTGTIDRDLMARFNFEVGAGEARPLYFFDGDGSRAGGLWYVRRMTVDHVEPELARREGEDLGLSSGAYLQTVLNYVAAESTGRLPVAATAPVSDAPVSKLPAEIRPKAETAKPSPAKDTATSQPRITPVQSAATPDHRGMGEIQAMSDLSLPAAATTRASLPASPAKESSPPGLLDDPTAWRAFAAAVITTLSLPLAYLGRTVAPIIVAKTWASLPAVGLRPKSLPAESGARI